VLRIARVGKIVTLSWENLVHTSLSTGESAAGFIPTEYRPSHSVTACTTLGAVVRQVTIESDGTFAYSYRDWAGTASSQVNTGTGTISWVID
jgi:hypothetical protein